MDRVRTCIVGLNKLFVCVVGVNMVGAPRGGSMENYPGSLSNNETLGVQHNPTMNNPSSKHYIQQL